MCREQSGERVHEVKLERWTGARACGFLMAMFKNSSLKLYGNEKSLMDCKLEGRT